jgi:hypothetical protein
VTRNRTFKGKSALMSETIQPERRRATEGRSSPRLREQWGFIFLLAYVGAAIYFVSVSDGSFWGVVLGLLQAIVWPVYVVYHVLRLLAA